MKKTIIGLTIILVCAILSSVVYFNKAEAQSDIAVQLLTSGTTFVYERYYEGDGDIDVEIPCETVRDHERQTLFLYGWIKFPNNNGSGSATLVMIPKRGEDWSGALISYSGDASTIGLVSNYSLSIYPGSKARIEWTNPGTIPWRLVIFTRAVVN